MKIDQIELHHINLEMARPFETSFGHFVDRHLVVLKIYSDLGICYSEAPSLVGPFYSYETTQTTLHILRDYIAPSVLHKEVNNIEELHENMRFIRGHNIAKSALDTAFYHLAAANEKKSLSQYLGGSLSYIDAGISIGIEGDIDALFTVIDQSIQKKYKRVKIKIKPGWDIKIVEEIRKNFGDIPLMVDANSAYTLDDFEMFKKMDKFNLLMIEQPLGYDDIYEHSILQKQIQTPICLDESIESVADAKLALEIGACKVINIKLSRVGGIFPSILIHDLCEAHGVPVWSGGMFESAIGKADSTALCTLPNFKLPADIAPSDRYFKKDIVRSGLTLKDGQIRVPINVGLGVEVDDETLKEVAVEPIVTIR